MARLLLAVTRFYGKPDAKVTREEIIMDYGLRPPPRRSDWRTQIGAYTKLGRENFRREKWDALALEIASIQKSKKRIKGDTLRTSSYNGYLKKRARILVRWLPAIKAYFKPS